MRGYFLHRVSISAELNGNKEQTTATQTAPPFLFQQGAGYPGYQSLKIMERKIGYGTQGRSRGTRQKPGEGVYLEKNYGHTQNSGPSLRAALQRSYFGP